MLTSVPPDLLRAVWEYPLFDAYTDGGRGVLVWASKWRKGHAAHMAKWHP